MTAYWIPKTIDYNLLTVFWYSFKLNWQMVHLHDSYLQGRPNSRQRTDNTVTFNRVVTSRNDVAHLKSQSKDFFAMEQYTPRERSQIVQVCINLLVKKSSWDEAHFTLNQTVNKQNCRFYVTQNSQIIHEVLFYMYNLSVRGLCWYNHWPVFGWRNGYHQSGALSWYNKWSFDAYCSW